jgi:predicted acylesterase/phospholipase RssA
VGESAKATRSQPRRALVLEGGGARGAWQFGVLKAFADSGLTFEAVSGTSVGALNGALWCTEALDLGEELWTTISREKAFSLRKWLLPIAIVGLACRIFQAFALGLTNGSIDKKSPTVRAFSIILLWPMATVVWALCSSILPTHSDLAWDVKFLIKLLLVGWLGIAFPLRTEISNDPDDSGKVIFISFALWCLGLCIFAAYASEQERSAFAWTVVFTGATPFIIISIAFLAKVLNLSIFDAAPIARLAQKVLDKDLRRPLFTTAARVARFIDPDDYTYGIFTYSAFPPAEMAVKPTPHRRLVPVYSDLNTLSPSDACDALMASSALPLGLLKWRRGAKGGDPLIDGGVVDNLPWFPLIRHDAYDELVLVRCNPPSDWDHAKAVAEWSERDRMLRVLDAKFSPPDPSPKDDLFKSVRNQPPTVIPFRRPVGWPRLVIQIGPSKPLGTFITGTLGFLNCAHWVADGYQAGMEAARSILTHES